MHEISIKAEEIFSISNFHVTNALFLSVLVAVFFIIVALILRRRIHEIPGKLQGVFELLLEEILGFMTTILGNRDKAEKYLPLVATIFLFVMISNWFGLFPVVGSVVLETMHGAEHTAVPLFRAPASDLNFTIALAIISVVSINLLAVGALGFKRHITKFFTVKNPIMTFTGLLEFLSEFVRIISFSFRLFGNVFAGEVLLIIVGFLVPYVLPLPFLFLEVFVGFIQAFIFAMLTLVFLATAVSEETAH